MVVSHLLPVKKTKGLHIKFASSKFVSVLKRFVVADKKKWECLEKLKSLSQVTEQI